MAEVSGPSQAAGGAGGVRGGGPAGGPTDDPATTSSATANANAGATTNAAADATTNAAASGDGAWRVIGASVVGASHIRNKLPNQDFIGWRPEGGRGVPVVLAVSDGHGSAKSFRSDRGARFAVDAMLRECGELLEMARGPEARGRVSAIKRLAEGRLPQLVVRSWQEAVDADLGREPFTDGEWAALEKRDGRGRAAVERNPRLAYGATVLGAVAADHFVLYVQLGDGDILVVADDGRCRRPIARDERLMANETTSLCGYDPAREVRVQMDLHTEASPPPALVLVSTDGYANSFRDDDGFLKVGGDILEMIVEDGLDRVAGDLSAWLDDASRSGSGDDVTLGVLCRLDALEVARRLVGERQREAAAKLMASAIAASAATDSTRDPARAAEAAPSAAPKTAKPPTGSKAGG